MLLLIPGLLAYHFGFKTSAPESQTAPKVAAKKPASPRVRPPPPPPPPLPEASVQKEPEAKRTVARGRRAPSGCAGDCSGKVTGVLTSALHAKARQGRGCYERALRQNPMLEGRMSIRVRVGQLGQICSARVASDTVRDPTVSSCVLQLFRGATFPPPNKGCVDVRVPLSFVTKT